jgi:TRAP-type mannitol/chloroaromatic compound transport system permease large subunit
LAHWYYSWRATVGWVALFVAACVAPSLVRCNGDRCFSGTFSYAPALISMVVIGFRSAQRSQQAGRLITAAAALFMLALAVRTISFSWCEQAARSTLAIVALVLWLVLIATTLHLLLRGAIANVTETGASNAVAMSDKPAA